MADTAIRTYELILGTGETLRVEIPENFKVTYGPVVGAANTKGVEYGKPNAFRVWESDTKQRMLVSNVHSFRDTSLPMMARAVRKFGQDVWVADDGKWVGEKASQVEKAWKPIDEIAEAFPPDEEENPLLGDRAKTVKVYPR